MKREELFDKIRNMKEKGFSGVMINRFSEEDCNIIEDLFDAFLISYHEELEVKVSAYEAKVYTYEKIIANSNFAPMFQFQFRTKPIESKPTADDILNMLRGMIEGKTSNDFIQVQVIENLIERIEEEQRSF